MFHRHRKMFISLLMISLLLSASCKDASLNKAARAVQDVLVTINAVTDFTINARAQGLFTDEEVAPIETVCKQVTVASQQANAIIKNLNTLDPASKVNLFQIIDPIFKAFSPESIEAISRIRNPDAKAKVQLWFNSIQASLSIIEAAVASPATASKFGGTL